MKRGKTEWMGEWIGEWMGEWMMLMAVTLVIHVKNVTLQTILMKEY